MYLWKDHPKEIKAGCKDGDFPPPSGRAAANAWPPRAQDDQGPELGSNKSKKKKKKDEEDEYVSTSLHSSA